MKTRFLVLTAATAVALGTAPAFADHPSKNGEGTANMPNDIHNTRVETREANDSEAFRDFVRYGEGADSVNRFESEETIAPRAQEKKGNASERQEQDQTRAGERSMDQEKKMERTRTPDMQGTGNDRSVRARSNRESRNTNRTTTQRSTGRQRGSNGGSRGGGSRGGGKR